MAYSKKTWNNDEVITQEAMNNIESGVASNDTKTHSRIQKSAGLRVNLLKQLLDLKMV